MKTILIDLDNTITIDDADQAYKDKLPNKDIIKKLQEYKNQNWKIVV